MKAEDLKLKTEDELKKLLLDSRKEQFNQRFQKGAGTLENTAQIRKTRRNIARIKTVLTDKASGASAQKPAATKKTAAKKTAKSKTAA